MEPRQTLTCPIPLTIKSPAPDSTSLTALRMPRTLRVGMIGYRFMGKAHSNAWRQAPRFFNLPADVEMHTIVGRDPKALEDARVQLGWQNSSTDWKAVVNS